MIKRVLFMLFFAATAFGQNAGLPSSQLSSIYNPGTGTISARIVQPGVFPDPVSGITTFGDSICVGSGTTTPGGSSGYTYDPANTNAFESLLAVATGGTNNNYCYGGSQTADAVTAQMFANSYAPQLSDNPLVLENAGANEYYWCEAVGGNVTGCRANAAYAQRTLDTWPATANKFYGKQWTATGTWTTDSRLSAYAMMSTTNGSALSTSFTVPPNVSGVCVAWEALDGNGGIATLKIDGTLVDTLNAFGNNGQTVKTGYIVSTWTVWTQCYAATPGTHTLLVAVTSATGAGNVFALVAGLSPTDPTKHYYGAPRVISTGVTYQQNDTNSAVTAFYNTQKQTVVTALAGFGFPVAFADVRAYMDSVYDMSSSTVTKPDGTVCVASTQPGPHPNDCGHRDEYRAIAALVQPMAGTTTIPPVLSLFATAPASTESYTSVNKGGLASSTGLNPGFNLFSGSAGGRNFGSDLGWVGTVGGFAYNTYINRRFAPTGNLIGDCFYPDGSTPPTAQSQFTCATLTTSTGWASYVPASAPSMTFGTGNFTLNAMNTYSPSLTPTAVAAGTCSDQVFSVSGITIADEFTQLRPPSALGNVSATVYPASTGNINIHFCNPTGSSVTPPAGTYILLAIH